MNDMPDPSQLIRGPFNVTMGDRGPAPLPSQTLVFSTDDGQVVELSRRPSAMASMKFRYRYEIDTSDHVYAWTEVLPSGTGGFAFQAALEARWNVSASGEVVRRNIKSLTDAELAVSLAMRELLWPHAGLYGIERLDEFALFVRSTVSSRPHTVPQGLTVSALTVRLSLDDQAVEHLRALKKAQFDTELALANHTTNITNQRLGDVLQVEREQAILAAAKGEGGLMVRLIAEDPSRLHDIMVELGNRHDISVERKSKMLKDLIDAKLIQPAEAQSVWREMDRPAPLFGGPAQLPTGPAPRGQLTSGAFSPSDEPMAPLDPLDPLEETHLVAGVVMAAEDSAPPRPRVRSYEEQVSGPDAAQPPSYPAPRPRNTADDSGQGSSNVVGDTPVGHRRNHPADGS